MLDRSDQVTRGCKQHHDTRGDETAGRVCRREQLKYSHGAIEACSCVVGRHLTDQGIELGRGGTYTEEERDFDEDEDESANPARVSTDTYTEEECGRRTEE